MLREVVKFGEDLELDLGAYELRRSGRPLKLERIPMEVLFLLVERRGQLVTREEIIERIWGKDVFLDTDNSINAAIRKIRQVLKDDPEKPLFVQTVTGKGYRFVASTEEVRAPAGGQGGSKASPDVVGSALVNSRSHEGLTSTSPTAVEPISTACGTPRRKWLSWRWLAALVAMLSVAVALLDLRHTRGRRLASTPAHTRIVLAVLPFTNLSDDPSRNTSVMVLPKKRSRTWGN